MNLLDMILSQNNGQQVEQLARQFGIGTNQAQDALSKLVPALGQGVRNNISNQGGLDDLLGAIQRGNHGRYVDDPSALGDPRAVEEGNGILGHLLGSKDTSRQLAGAASQSTGLDSSLLKKMLPVIASMVMGSLSKQSSNLGMQPSGRTSSGGGAFDLLTNFLDADKDGSILDDLAGMAGKFFR
ncbi:MAG: DUF937 domain-containing protein [Chromatiales bacterium]|nr:DUF937 domain-containing protein [Chromatiales bacterium]